MRYLVFPLAVLAWLPACSQENQTHPSYADYEAPASEPLPCVPNLDGQIDANELQQALGIPVSYLVSAPGTTRPVDVAGAVGSDGRMHWDWSAASPDDRVARFEASALDGKWYASSFPDGQFVAPLDAGKTIDSIYSHTDQALYLHGVASVEADPADGRTLMVYDQPIELYRFPLVQGSTWVSAGKVQDGLVKGLPYAGRDVYEVNVDATGELTLPDLSFSQVLRVRTKITLEPAVGQSVSQWQASFLFECFGEVGRATSEKDEAEPNFTVASEVRRFGLL